MIDINIRLDQFLFDYRIATHATTKESPASLLLGRNFRTRFDLLKPNVHTNQEKQTNSRNRSNKEFEINEIVGTSKKICNKQMD